MIRRLFTVAVVLAAAACNTGLIINSPDPENTSVDDSTPCARAALVSAPVPILNAQAVTTNDGTIYLFNNHNADGSLSPSIYSYDPLGTWSTVAQLPSALIAANVQPATGGDKLVLFGDLNLWYFDPTTLTFSDPVPHPIAGIVSVTPLGSGGVLALALGGGQVLTYRPDGLITPLPSLPLRLSIIGVRLVADSRGTLYEVDELSAFLSPGSPSWQRLPAMRFPRYSPGLATWHSLVYAVGGELDEPLIASNANEMEIFDPSIGTWRSGVELTREVSTAAAVISCGGMLYVFGSGPFGAPNFGDPNRSVADYTRVARYDPVTRLWGISP